MMKNDDIAENVLQCGKEGVRQNRAEALNEFCEEYADEMWKMGEEVIKLRAENAALRERLEKTEHRAEVAEKALKIVAYEIPCDDWCPFSQKCNVELNGENWYQCCFDEYLRQAEKELAEEEKE